jgi:hypothetical protein
MPSAHPAPIARTRSLRLVGLAALALLLVVRLAAIDGQLVRLIR